MHAATLGLANNYRPLCFSRSAHFITNGLRHQNCFGCLRPQVYSRSVSCATISAGAFSKPLHLVTVISATSAGLATRDVVQPIIQASSSTYRRRGCCSYEDAARHWGSRNRSTVDLDRIAAIAMSELRATHEFLALHSRLDCGLGTSNFFS